MILAAALLVQTLMSMLIFAPLIVAPAVVDALGVQHGLVGLYAPVAFGFGIVGSLTSGILLSMTGPWRLSVACLLAGSAGTVLMATGSLPCFALGIMIVGLSYGPVTAAGAKIILDGSATRLSLKMSVRQAGVPLGSSLTGLTMPLMGMQLGWLNAFLPVAAAGAVTALGLILLSPQVRAEKRPAADDPVNTRRLSFGLWRSDRRFRALALTASTFSSMQNIFVSFLSLHLVTHLRMDIASAGMILGASHLTGIGARLFWGWLADWFRPVAVIGLLGLIMSATSIATGLLSPATPVALVVAVIVAFGATVTGWNGVLLAQTTQAVPRGIATQAVAETVIFTYVGFMVGPPLFAGAGDLTTMPYAFMIAGGICTVSTLTYLAVMYQMGGSSQTSGAGDRS